MKYAIGLLAVFVCSWNNAHAATLLAGAAKVDITDVDAGPVDGPMYARALVLKNDTTMAAIITVDAVAIGEIGPIGNDYLPNVRAALKKLGIPPTQVIANASHCHGLVCADADQRTIQAVKQAIENLVPVRVGAGSGHEDGVSINRRLKLKNGREIDVRHAYSMPADKDVAKVGPIDPEIGVLRLDRMDGRTLAVVYNFACHPIQGAASKGNTADMTGFSSKVIEENTSDGAVALFVQGCGGDINPVFYKDVDHPRDAEPLGNQLGLSTLKAYRKIQPTEDDRLQVINETLALPRADNAEKIAATESEIDRLLKTLRGTSLSFKTFMPLAVKYKLAPEFPSYYSHRYLHDEKLGRKDLPNLDAENRQNIERYIANIHTMEQLTRLQTNLRLLKKHQAENVAAGSRTVDVELVAMRIGDFALLTFPGELTVQIGLNIKEKIQRKNTFVAGYTNGYIYYAPTTEQLLNVGGAQEDSDCILAPDWQPIFETKAVEMLKKITN
ncbi:hypothetical protein [Thalassoroseus pseudoceratinae]|uniref:hypothetical protein n=1 Tax=Thalassoroseus pseudoceratinae TaxID=2713176 RepID=UPI0019821873|nr:hypothetical protein [Thalassoroseus pseudoceratinae]